MTLQMEKTREAEVQTSCCVINASLYSQAGARGDGSCVNIYHITIGVYDSVRRPFARAWCVFSPLSWVTDSSVHKWIYQAHPHLAASCLHCGGHPWAGGNDDAKRPASLTLSLLSFITHN